VLSGVPGVVAAATVALPERFQDPILTPVSVLPSLPPSGLFSNPGFSIFLEILCIIEYLFN
jgi:hypothetical protein